MKNESLEILQTPQSVPHAIDDVADPFTDMPAAQGLPQPFFSSEAFADQASNEDRLYGTVGLTLLCSVLGWLVMYSREIITGLAGIYFFVVGTVMLFLHILA